MLNHCNTTLVSFVKQAVEIVKSIAPLTAQSNVKNNVYMKKLQKINDDVSKKNKISGKQFDEFINVFVDVVRSRETFI